MNDYLRLTSGEVKINTNSSIIGNEIIEQKPDFTHYKTTYANGIIVEFRQTPSEIVLTTNRKNMVLNSDGTVDIEV